MSWGFLAGSLLAFFLLGAIVGVVVVHGGEVRGLAVPIVVHALWDFTVFSGWATPDKAEAPSAPLVLSLLTFAWLVVLAVRRKSVAVVDDGSLRIAV